MVRLLRILTVGILFVSILNAAEYSVSTVTELKNASQKARPGDHIVIENGDWKDQKIAIELDGRKDNPITIRTREIGKHRISGRSSLEIKGDHLIIRGLVLDQLSRNKDGSLLKLRGSYCRLTQCTVTNCNPTDVDTKYHWVSIYGHHNRIDHCHFSQHHHKGVTLVVWLNEEPSGSHTIDHNYFGYRNKGNSNGFETIRIGTSHYHQEDANCLVIQNLFEQCNGELEIISNKSCGNKYIGNTFLNSGGALTLRHGARCLVAYNQFLGYDNKTAAGIRVIGSGHIIKGNHFEGLGKRLKGGISISASELNPQPNGYEPVNRVQFVDNRFINNQIPPFDFAEQLNKNKRTVLATKLTFDDNKFGDLIRETVIPELGEQVGLWTNNHFISNKNEFRSISPSPIRLNQHDVGPVSIAKQNSKTLVNRHIFGAATNVENYAFCKPSTDDLKGIVLDDCDALLEGAWIHSTEHPPYVGAGALVAQGDQARATYLFKPDQSCDYQVAVSYGDIRKRPSSTIVIINSASGKHSINLDQSNPPSGIHLLFQTIGTYRFESNKQYQLSITNVKGVSMADAIWLKPKP